MDGSGVGDVGAVVMRDRKRLAEDGMVVVVLPISAHDGNLLSEPEIITRGFIYVKESGDLMKELQSVARDAAENVSRKRGRDDGELKVPSSPPSAATCSKPPSAIPWLSPWSPDCDIPDNGCADKRAAGKAASLICSL